MTRPSPAQARSLPAHSTAPAERLATVTHDLLAAADSERRLVWTNPAWHARLGWTNAELAATSYHELVHPEDLARVRAAERAVLAGGAGDRPATELRLRRRDGDHDWFLFSTSYLEGDDCVYLSGREITDRKLGEEELRAADERFHAVTGAMRDGVVSADVNGRITYWNEGAAAIFGRTAAEALGRPLTTLMPARYQDAHRAGVARFLATGAGRVMGSAVELEGVRADGDEFPLELSLTSWRHHGSMCLTAVVRDLSDRVTARRALREAEERFASAFEGAAVGMLIATPDGRILRANRALCELAGRREAELTGQDLDRIVAAEGGDAPSFEAMLAGRTRRLAGDYRLAVTDGEPRDVRMSLTLVRDAGDAPLHFVGEVEDRTEQRRTLEAVTLATARYEGLVAHLDDAAVHLVDTELRLVSCEGGGGAQVYGTTATEGRLLTEVLAPAALARVEPEYRAALAGDRRDFELGGPGGTAHRIQIAPLRDDLGRVMGALSLARDVSAHRRVEQALEAQTTALERTERELEEFAYVASHDLSEPLRMVSSYLQLLRRRYRGRLGDDADEFIDYAVDGAARMRELIDDLLAYSRAGRDDAPLERVDLGAVVARVLDRLGREGGDRLHASVGPLPAVQGDARQLGQLLENLLGNAAKFVSADGVAEVMISAEREAADWRVTVEDNGIGIDPARAERIFRMFQRLHTRDEYPGTGIGLAIARKVVDRHGGRIWVEPAPGQGSRFRFTLPAAEGEA